MAKANSPTPASAKSYRNDLETKVEAAWPASCWRSMHVGVAVSGGPDSVALLRAVLWLASRTSGSGRVFALHVNHGLRPAAAEDQRWLERQCRQLGVELLCRDGDVAKVAAEQGDGVEAAARSIRYRLLTELAESVGARFVALGHTCDDQVETVLFQMLRGAGLRGLTGMPRTRPLSPSVTLVRPLLAVQRSEVEAYLQAINQPSRHDASNQDFRHRRNRIRHNLLPLLRKHFNADVDAAIWRLSEQAAEWSETLDELCESILARCRPVNQANGGFSLELAPLASQPPYLIRETLRLAWRRRQLPEQGMNYASWVRLAELVRGGPVDKPIALPGDVLASASEGRLVVRTSAARSEPRQPSDQ